MNDTPARPGVRFRIGVDVGGTFTDVVLVDDRSGEVLLAKVHTVPEDPSQGCINGIEKALRNYSIRAPQISFVVHGTTIATNTIIEGKAAKAGLITSEGFRDVLEIAYQTRPNLYDIFYDKPKPLIPRYLCLGVPQRIGPDGSVRVPLDKDALRLAARKLRDEGVEAIAVAFLHSYRDPTDERSAREVIAEECPGIPIVLSSDVCPEFREYPRTSTAVVNAVLLPRVTPYVARLEDRLRDAGVAPPLHLMTSAGGITAAATAKREPVHLVESGPAAGVIGAVFVADQAGYKNLLALDIGGTTAKAAVVNNGRPQIAEQFEVGAAAIANVTSARGKGYPVLTPVISLVEIGSGGGSIAQVDPGGAITVGPQSAGANPGPVSYGQGGTMPTLTDANLVLGRLNPDFFLGGEFKLNKALAEQAILERVGVPAGLDLIEAARAIVDIANAKMTSALYFITVEQGIDPRDYVLVPSGGAGPLHAVAIAQVLSVPTVLVPPAPGLNSAVGLLASDLKHDVVRTYMRREADIDATEVASIYAEMEASIRALLQSEGADDEDIVIIREIEACYVGQSFRLKLPLPPLDATFVPLLVTNFHEKHRDTYGFANPAERTQLVNLRLNGIGKVQRPILRRLARATDSADRAIKGRRPVFFLDPARPAMTPIYDRQKLFSGDEFSGPAIVEQMDTTVVVMPNSRARVDDVGNLVISITEPSA